jgi:putative endonuclease
MALNTEQGQKGEALAVSFLCEKGFHVLERNWRYSHYEIDIIAIKDELLHFIEVKLRASDQYGNPEESVSKKKMSFLLKGIDQYLFLHPHYTDFRLDLLSIVENKEGAPEYFFIEDVYLYH